MTPSTAAPTNAGALADERKHYLGAIRLRLAQFYDECPNDARLREHISDECDWLDVEIARNSAPQETRGDEPVAHMTYNSIKAAFVEYHKTMTVMDEPASFDSYSQGYVAGWNAKEAPHQSPRLELEGLIKECARIAESFKYSEATKACTNGASTYGNDGACDNIAAAILALLSPDTTVVSSTNRAPLPSESLYTPEEAEPHIEGES